MGAVTNAGNNFITTGGNETVVATPAVGDNIVIVCASSGRTITQTPTVTDNNSSGTYTLVAQTTNNASADSMWVYVRNALIAAASSTTFTYAIAGDSGGGLVVLRITGLSLLGGDAVRQWSSQTNQGATTPAPVLPAAPDPNNVVLTCALNLSSPGNITAPSASNPAWVRHADVGYTVPSTGMDVCTRNGQQTSATITWGGASATGFGSIAVEFNNDDLMPGLVTRTGYR